MSTKFLPLLSDYDPSDTAEGTIDPLGLYAIADSLALRLAPGVRERQSNPRFLTAIAVSSAVCSSFDEGTVATDGVSEPWQVFEWYVVEGLVRTLSGQEIRGLPGSDKARRALAAKLPLAASRYLKSPSVFGFHGVYKVLAKELDVAEDGKLGANGYRLLTVWEREEGLEGFLNGRSPGGEAHDQLRAAVSAGLAKGCLDRSGAWSGWTFFKEHLSPHRFKPGEAEVIKQTLSSPEADFRRQTVNFLVSESGQSLWRESGSERLFHEALKASASADLRVLLEAIARYEEFCRLLQDAFDDCLMLMTRKRGRIGAGELSLSDKVARAAKMIPKMYEEVSDHLEPFREATRYREFFSELADAGAGPAQWTELLMEHHVRTQGKKPPNGKNPWFERFDDGSYAVRPGYTREEGGLGNTSVYVHQYRTTPLWSFAVELGQVKP